MERSHSLGESPSGRLSVSALSRQHLVCKWCSVFLTRSMFLRVEGQPKEEVLSLPSQDTQGSREARAEVRNPQASGK